MAERVIDGAPRQPGSGAPGDEFFICSFGRKHSGKSVLSRLYYRQYPFNKICIDVNGDADPGPGAEKISKLGDEFPRLRNGDKPVNLHYTPDPGSPTYLDDLDRAIGMSLWPKDQPALVWLGEIQEFQSMNPRPNMRRLLSQSRHHAMSVLVDGPRPQGKGVEVNPQLTQQADFVAVFPMPNRRDQERIADDFGIEPTRLRRELPAAWNEEFRYLWIHRKPVRVTVRDDATGATYTRDQNRWALPPIPLKGYPRG